MKIVCPIMMENPWYKAGKEIVPKGIILYSLGRPQPSAKVLFHNWNRTTYDKGCPHALVGVKHGEVYQTLPWVYEGGHGDDNVNKNYIGIVMCEPRYILYDKDGSVTILDEKEAVRGVTATYKAAVELVAQLFKDFGWSPSEIYRIMSQDEAKCDPSATMFRNPEYLWGKLPLSYTMQEFRMDVSGLLIADQKAEEEKIENAPGPHDDPVPRKIKVDVENLRIRSEPCTGNNTTGKYTGVGVFEITEIQNGTGSSKGWAKLADGSGWVSLDYAELL